MARELDSRRQKKVEAAAYGGAAPADPVAAIQMLADRVDLANRGEIPKRALDRALGEAWSQAVCAALSWENIELRDDEGRWRSNVIASPDRRYFVDPQRFMRRVLRLDRGSSGDNTVELLFNMLRDGSRLPPSKRGLYLELS